MEAFSVCERVAKNFHHKSPRMKNAKKIYFSISAIYQEQDQCI